MSLKDLKNSTRPGPGFAAAPTPIALTMGFEWINQAIVRMNLVAQQRPTPA
ncbi:hypothetical protein [Variovorax sp. CAN15]|uniref:hypothetical protein n=1 Tax=Variovorax sp. CAN15 TaxID=3046727 RepID=UPI0026480636|nr:hypothetical protein [Variovorax sp. CAN15]